MAERSPFLRNSYWVLRHGKSIPNEKGLIVSSMENGTLPEFGLAPEGVEQARLAGELFHKENGTLPEFGLAPEGVEQARLAGELFHKELKEKNILLENVLVCYSPFTRTTNTAKVAADVLGIPSESPQFKVMPEIRERFFGPSLELLSHDKYPEIWALDEKDPFMPPEGGESVADVVSRLSTALEAIEAEFNGCTILVVSHGDPLQILQTALHAAKEHASSGAKDIVSRIKEVTNHSVLSQHRKFALLTGELRKIF